MSGEWAEGVCERTNKKGYFPPEAVYVLPAINQPTADILVSFVTVVSVTNFVRKLWSCDVNLSC